jgi:hypothetical protein
MRLKIHRIIFSPPLQISVVHFIFGAVNLYPMKLNLTVEGRILASIPVDATQAANEYYLKAFQRLLVLRHQKAINRLQKKPTFFLETPAEVRRPVLN